MWAPVLELGAQAWTGWDLPIFTIVCLSLMQSLKVCMISWSLAQPTIAKINFEVEIELTVPAASLGRLHE